MSAHRFRGLWRKTRCLLADGGSRIRGNPLGSKAANRRFRSDSLTTHLLRFPCAPSLPAIGGRWMCSTLASDPRPDNAQRIRISIRDNRTHAPATARAATPALCAHEPSSQPSWSPVTSTAVFRIKSTALQGYCDLRFVTPAAAESKVLTQLRSSLRSGMARACDQRARAARRP